MKINIAKLKKIAIKGLKVLKVAADVASKFFPPIGIAGSVIGAVLDVVDEKEDIKDLQQNLNLINQDLVELSKQNQGMVEMIIKETADLQFNELRWTLRNQYKKYLEMINAPPEEMEKRSQAFVKAYQEMQGNQHLYTLYESVIGVPKVFSKPILQVYKQFSGSDRNVMTNLTQELFGLFSIGCMTMMAHAVLIGDDVESREEEWEENMKLVTLEMEKVLKDYK